jgi:hypothetical protein
VASPCKCDAPYYEPHLGEHDRRIGHECCSTVAGVYAEMLAALRLAMDDGVSVCCADGEDRWSLNYPAVKAIRAAIAKAEGR